MTVVLVMTQERFITQSGMSRGGGGEDGSPGEVQEQREREGENNEYTGVL